MNRATAETKRQLEALYLFPGISEETQWRPMPQPQVKHQPPIEEREIFEEDIERWDGLA